MHLVAHYWHVILWVLPPVLAFAWRRRDLAQTKSELAAVKSALEKMRATANLENQRANEESQKAHQLLDTIEGIVNEANECRELYLNASVKHGHAQSMMMTEISNLGRQYLMLASEFTRATGKPPRVARPKLSPAIKQVHDAYTNEHGSGSVEMPNTDSASQSQVVGSRSELG